MKSILHIFLVIGSFLFNNVNLASSGKILAVDFISSKSTKHTYLPLLHELARRGHQVTVLSSIPPEKPGPQNVCEIVTKEFDFQKERSKILLNSQANIQFAILNLVESICLETYDLPQVRKLMDEKFDLIIIQPMLNDCAFGFVNHFKTNCVAVTTPEQAMPTFFGQNRSSGNLYVQKTINSASELVFFGFRDWIWVPRMEAVCREKLGDSAICGVNELLNNLTLVLSNTHFIWNQPTMMAAVNVGGMHCQPAKTLPNDLNGFLNRSGDDGFIYFNMGSTFQEDTFPEKYKKMFINTFAKLKQKVLWKWNKESMSGLSNNVRLGKWLSQQDILGHSKIRLFISNGGFGDVHEAVCHRVPILGVTMFADQNLNIQPFVNQGNGALLDLNDDLSEKTLFDRIQEMLNNTSYEDRAKKISKVFHDQPDKPLHRAAFWTEFIMRHPGEVQIHRKPGEKHLNFIQHNSIGLVIWALLSAVFLYLLMMLTKLIFCRSFVKRKTNSSNDSRKKIN